MVTPPLDLQRLAMAAAQQANEGAAAVLEYGRNGQDLFSAFQPDAIEKLADALKIALEIEAQVNPSFSDEHGQLLGACSKFLDGWA